jgi:hypothetical protein
MVVRKNRITQEKRVLFIARNIRLVTLMFSDKATRGVKPLIDKARKELGYSKATGSMRIHDSIYHTWAKMTGRRWRA